MTPRLKKLLQKKHFKTNEDTPMGCNGAYFPIGYGIGVKVYTSCDGFKTPEKARQSWLWWCAARSFNNLKKAKDSGFTPRPYGMTTVRCDGKYYPAVVMQHIEGSNPVSSRGLCQLASRLEKYGLTSTGDIGCHNAIRSKTGKLYLVDADLWHLEW